MRWAAAAVVPCVLALAGCVSAPASRSVVEAIAPPIPPDGGAFTVAENTLDTWNTIGKVLVAMDDVQYQGRAQMLGLYTIGFRGEQFLIRTQAVVLRDATEAIHTRVDALGPTGKPTQSPAAIEMLARLAQRVPMEVARYRQPVKVPKSRAGSKKKRKAQ
jgi:hypothetical protein